MWQQHTLHTAQLRALLMRRMKGAAVSRQYKRAMREFSGPRVNESFVITRAHVRVTHKVKTVHL